MTTFEQAAVRYRPAMLRQAERLCGCREDAEDIVQEALILCWQDWDAILATGRIVPCIRRNVWRAWAHWQRMRATVQRGGRAQFVPLEQHTAAVPPNQHDKLDLQKVGRFLEAQPNGADVLAFAMGSTLAEIAERDGVSYQAVQDRVRTARDRLRRKFPCI